MQKVLHTKNMGSAVITFPVINRWTIINLFKAFLIGTFGAPDKRFTHKESPRYGLHLQYHDNGSCQVKIKERKLDIEKPFPGIRKKTFENIYELYIWNNEDGFHRLLSADTIPPAILTDGLPNRPEFLICINRGFSPERKWCNISCARWPEENSALQMDWHDKLAIFAQNNYA